MTEEEEIDPEKSYLGIVRRILNITVVAFDSQYITCYVDNIQEANHAIDIFRRKTGTSYSSCKLPKDFGNRCKPENASTVHWCDNETHPSKRTSGVQIVPDQGVPHYIKAGIRILECNFGPDNNLWNKRKWEATQNQKRNVDHPQGDGINRLQIYKGRRLGCPAKIEMKEAFVITGYNVAANGIDKLAIERCVRQEAIIKGSVECKRRIYIRFPDRAAHDKHSLASYASLLNPVDPRVVDIIRRSLLKGITRRSDIRGVITLYNEDHFPEVKINNAAFYPSDTTLSSIMYRSMLHNRYSHMDEERVLALVADYIAANPNDLIYFRPKNKEVDVDEVSFDHTEEDDILFHVPHTYTKKDQSTMLWLHQSRMQLYILKRYNNLILMDATYKTCKLSLPLFFLVVKTNVGYCVVGEFIIQQEDTDSIAEALSYFSAHWKSNQITVNAFMVDKAPAEHAALRAVFPMSEVYLCDFHRLQCWDRFLRTARNGLAQHRDTTFKMLRAIGESCTEEEYEENLETLHNSYVWNKDSRLSDYFHREWSGNEEMWVYLHRIGKQLYDHTNNGVESKNKMFKYSFLNCCRNLLMSKLTNLIVEVFVPMQVSRYAADNAKTNPDIAETLVEGIPEFLRCRPPWFIRHCINEMDKAQEWNTCEIVEENVFFFKVRSSQGDKFYDVDIDVYNPRCSCYSWLRSELPCKHIFAVLAHTYVSWYDLPESFRNHPLFSLDNDILKLCDPTYVPRKIAKEFETQIITEMTDLLKPVESTVKDEDYNRDQTEITPEENPAYDEEQELNTLCFNIREQCSLITNVSYNAHNVHATRETLDKLADLYKQFYKSCEDEHGNVKLKKGDLKFRTLRNKNPKRLSKPKKPGFFGNKRIVPMYKPPKMKRRDKVSTNTPLQDIIGDLPSSVSDEADPKKRLESNSSQPHINAPPLSQGIVMESDDVTDLTLDFLLDNAEDVYVDEKTKAALESGSTSFTPFVDINAYKRSIQMRVPDKVMKFKPKEVTSPKDISEWNRKILSSDLDKFKNTKQIPSRVLTSSIYYVVAKIGPYVLKDVDMLPLQGEHWQTDQLMSAYLHLISTRHSSPNFKIKLLSFEVLRKILQGSVGDMNPEGEVTRVHFTANCHSDLPVSTLLMGTYHQNGNHWTLVMIDIKQSTFLFVDPLAANEVKEGRKLMANFQRWTCAYNSVKGQGSIPTMYKLRTIQHAKQQDGRNCGIWTLWFARRILEKKHVMEADVGDEGARIATDILSSSECISLLCAKCGLKLIVDDAPVKMCAGNCRPRKTFHVRCLPDFSRNAIKFYCQVCDPSTREEYCFSCSRKADGQLLAYCRNGDYTGCTNFVHAACLPAGSNSYKCGLCTLRIN